MKDGMDETNGDSSEESVGRRKLLAAVGAASASGLAGCPSVTINIGDDGGDGDGGDGDGGGIGDIGGGGSDGDGGGSDGGDGASGDVSCTDITNGYDQKDVGERPLIFDFEYPAMFDELVYTQAGPLAFYEAEQSIGDGLLVDMVINQVTDPEESVGESEQGASGATVTFNGEEVEFVGSSSASSLGWVGNLPYEVDGERQIFTMTLELTSDTESNECGDALREAAQHIVNSIEVNSETTL